MPQLPSILVISDQPHAIADLQAALPRYQVLSVELDLDGDLDGSASISTDLFDCDPLAVLVSIQQSQAQVLELCQTIRAVQPQSYLPILVFSVDQTAKLSYTDALRAGADDYFQLPIAPEELTARLEARLRPRQWCEDWRSLLQFRDQLLHVLVHDLKNPVSGIMLSAAILQMGELTETQKLKIQQINEATYQLRSLLNTITVLDKIQFRQVLLQPERSNLVKLAQQSLDGVTAIAQQRSIKIETDLAEQAEINLELDPDLFTSALHRLLSTTVKSAPSNSELNFQLSSHPHGQAQLQITAQGNWLSAELGQQLGQANNLSDWLNLNNPNLLNLTFCKFVIEAHGGRFSLDQSQSGRLQFTLRLSDRAPLTSDRNRLNVKDRQ